MKAEYRQFLIQTVICLALISAMVFGVREWDKRHQPKIGVVDIAGIMAAKEKLFTDYLLKPGITDEDKKRAFTQVGEFGKELSGIITSLPAECRCVVLNKAALIAGDAIDLTPSIKKRLGLP